MLWPAEWLPVVKSTGGQTDGQIERLIDGTDFFGPMGARTKTGKRSTTCVIFSVIPTIGPSMTPRLPLGSACLTKSRHGRDLVDIVRPLCRVCRAPRNKWLSGSQWNVLRNWSLHLHPERENTVKYHKWTLMKSIKAFRGGAVHIRKPNLVRHAAEDVLATDGASPSAGTGLTT